MQKTHSVAKTAKTADDMRVAKILSELLKKRLANKSES
jgi:hypothetical protein